MKKKIALLGLLALVGALVAPGWAARPTPPPPGGSRAAGLIAAAGKEVVQLLPESTIAVYVFNLEKVLENEIVVKALQDPKVRVGWNEFVTATGIDPKRDCVYAGFGMPMPKDPSQLFGPPGGMTIENLGIIVKLRYNQARLLSLLRTKNPNAIVETTNGVTTVSLGVDDMAKDRGTYGWGEGVKFVTFAFLDSSHIVFGDAKGVQGIIDVYKKKAAPLAKNPEMTALVSRIDKSAIAGCAVLFPPEYFKKFSGSNPFTGSFGEVKGMTMAVDDKNSTILADIRTYGGTKDQNTTRAATLNGLKVILGGTYASKEPALGELLSGIAVTSDDDSTRLAVTVSHETMGKLWRLARPKSAGPAPEPPGAGAEWTALNNEATDLHNKGNVGRAIEVETKALELAEKNVGPDHPDVALSLSNLAVFYDALGRHAEAEPLFKRSLAIREKTSGPDALDVALTLYNFGRHYETRGSHAEAEPLFSRALAIREKALGPDHPEVAIILDELGYLRHGQGQDTEAESFFKRALAVREKALGRDHALVARSLSNLGTICNFNGRYAEAEPLLKRALAVGEKALGPGHPEVAGILSMLGSNYILQDRYAKAEPLLKRSLAATEKSLGPDHPDLADPLVMLAMAYFGQRKFAKAEPLLERSLAIIEKTLGPDDAKIAQVLEALARLYRVTKREKQAEALEARAARIGAIKH